MAHSLQLCTSISQSLDPSFGLPTDVTFQIVTSGNEVKAHKYVLALASPVFKKQFFGDAKDTKDVIPVPETTEESFKTMIDFTYGKEIDWKKMTIEELFNVANMAKKYLIDTLMKEVQKVFEEVPITEENVVTVAATAEEFRQFEDISNTLVLHCAKFLKSVVNTQDQFVKYAAKHANTEMTQTALRLISRFPEVSPAEDNCTFSTFPPPSTLDFIDKERLVKEVQKAFEVHITEENVVTVAAMAEEFYQFEDISNTLVLHCAKFLKYVLKTQDQFAKYAAKHANTEMTQTALSLISKFPEVSPAEDKCGTCACGKDCRRGKFVLSTVQITVGDRVLINDQGKWQDALQRTCRRGLVTGKTNDKNVITVQFDDGSRAGCYVVHLEVPVFLHDSC
eukprot:GFUD01094473.1.p1 GENE.GFUD01094473.1~~GFUD01094473.1.p1  ORF type:complete len:394 (+),score=98.25 GFUD01094473.1:89-1270(+)